MANNMGNLVYQVKGNDDIPQWMVDLEKKDIQFESFSDGIAMIKGGIPLFVPIGDCVVHKINGLVLTCTKEHADMEGWSY